MYIFTIPPLRRARIAVILLLVSMTLLLLRNNLIPLYQSSNFVWSLSNYPESSTMFFGILAHLFSFTVGAGAGAGAVDISVSVLSSLFEASSVICKDPSHSDNASILFVLLELVLVPLCSLHYMCFIPNML